jgi:hypothetical protein
MRGGPFFRVLSFWRLRPSGAGVLLDALGITLTAVALSALPASVTAQDFWKHWGDGKGELNGYRLSQPRYGAVRPGSAILVFVTEDFADGPRVKSDSPKPAGTAYPVLKLNHLRDFQTGIYDYSTMTSVFARVAPGWPVRKVSFSSREWCGHVWHQLLPGKEGVAGVFHSYFEGEADGQETLPLPEGGVYEDALPIVLRGLTGEYLQAGESRMVPYLPSLFSSRMAHRRLSWGNATISRAASLEEVKVPAGTFRAVIYTVVQEGGPKSTWSVEASAPHRLLRRSSDNGEDAVLLGSTRQPYWQQNGLGSEKLLRELGLRVPSRVP